MPFMGYEGRAAIADILRNPAPRPVMRRTPLTNHVIASGAKQSIVQHLVSSDLCGVRRRHSMDCFAALATTGRGPSARLALANPVFP